MKIQELLAITELKERDRQLRRHFNPHTPLLEVKEAEFVALCVLLNLARPKVEIEDLCDIDGAKTVLNDPVLLGHCLASCHWFHTHNLKYPEPKVRLQRLIAPVPPLNRFVVTSANAPREYGWAHNASHIRYSQLFSASFLWDGKVTCIAKLLNDNEAVWVERFLSLGLSKKKLSNILQELIEALPAQAFPVEVSPFSVQIRVPYQAKYCAVTPVVSHSLQCQLQRLIFSGKGRSISVIHQHSMNISKLAASLNGYVRVLNYPPPARYSEKNFHQARTSKLLNKRTVLNESAIKSKPFLNALSAITNPDLGVVLKRRRQKRVAALRTIRFYLIRWLEPVLDWREHMEDSGCGTESLDSAFIESKLLKVKKGEWKTLVQVLSSHLHNRLQYSRQGRSFAYHQALLRPINAQISWILQRLEKAENVAAPNEQEIYLRLAGVKACDVHALANPYMVGVPSLSALFGLTHAFELGIKERLDLDFRITGTAWFLHNYESCNGSITPATTKLQDKQNVSNVSPPGLMDIKLCDLEMDLIFRLRVPRQQDLELFRNKGLILSALPNRFAGGSIHPPSLYQASEWYRLYNEPVSMYRELSRLPRGGCWVYASKRPVRDLEDLLSWLESDKRLRPAAVGYTLLEAPREREGAIADLHCYGEPALGLVECINPIDMRLAGLNDFLNSAFWQLYTDKHTALMKAAPSWEGQNETM